MPYKIWSVNEILTAADMNTYIGNQTILSFAGTAARSSAIGTPVEGMLSYVGSGTVEVYAGTATGWTTISGGGGGVTVGTSAPSTPAEGDLWWDSDDGKLYVYYDDGTSQQWVDAAGPSVAVQSTAPTGYEGQLWLDDTDGSMYVYYTDPDGINSQWIGAVSRSGGILQVVSTTKTDTFSASLAAGAATAVTGLSASITPRSTSSKILVSLSVSGANTADQSSGIILKRDGSAIARGDASGTRTRAMFGLGNNAGGSLEGAGSTFLDSPSTTSTVSYTADVYNISGTTQTVYINRPVADADATYYSRTISTITLIEVAG